MRWQRQALPSNRALPGGGRRSKGAESQSRRPVKKQNAPGTAVTVPRAKHPREDTHGCTKNLPTESAECQHRGSALFPHLQPQRVCRGHVLDQKPVSRRQDGGTSRKMGVMKHERQTKMSCFGRNFPRPAFLLPGENRRRTSAYQRDRHNVSILQRLRAGPRNPLCERLRLRLVGKRPGQEAHGTEEDK